MTSVYSETTQEIVSAHISFFHVMCIKMSNQIRHFFSLYMPIINFFTSVRSLGNSTTLCLVIPALLMTEFPIQVQSVPQQRTMYGAFISFASCSFIFFHVCKTQTPFCFISHDCGIFAMNFIQQWDGRKIHHSSQV